jgi:hypothetical protein
MNLEAWKRRVRKRTVQTYALYLVYRHPKTPWYAKGFATLIVGYVLSPIDPIPDFIPGVGLLDEMVAESSRGQLISYNDALCGSEGLWSVLTRGRESSRRSFSVQIRGVEAQRGPIDRYLLLENTSTRYFGEEGQDRRRAGALTPRPRRLLAGASSPHTDGGGKARPRSSTPQGSRKMKSP